MSELDQWSRDLIRSARGGDDPSPEQKRRLGAALAGAAAGGGLLVGSAAAAKVGGLALGAKIVAALCVVGALGVIGARALGPSETPLPHRAAAVPPRARLEPAPSPVASQQVGTTVREPAPPPVAPDAEPRPVRARATAAPSGPAPSLAEEVTLLRQARAALSAGDVARAQQLLAEHAASHPRGALALERSGLQAMARCRADPAGGRTAALKFVARHGDAPMAGAVREACGLK